MRKRCSLISTFVVRCLDSVMSLVLASVAEEASLSLTWSENSEDTFSHAEAQVFKILLFLADSQ